MKLVTFLVLFIVYFVAESVLYAETSRTDQAKQFYQVDVDEALLLTPLIEEGNICEARRLSKVSPNVLDTMSYAGYFTVNTTCENNLFFWFFLAEENWKEAPVLLWLQGEPGGSSLFGCLVENGPFELVNGEPQKRKYAWNKRTNLLYIDQPVSTGYSFSGKGCFTNSDQQCAIEVHTALVQFFKLFPELVYNRFYITGESYAGHYIPHLGKVIHDQNPTLDMKINLSAMMIGNPFIDSVRNTNISEYMHNLGLIDNNERKVLDVKHKNHAKAMKDSSQVSEKTVEAFNDYYNEFRKVLFNISKFNYYKIIDDFDPEDIVPYLTQLSTRRSLHVGNNSFLIGTGANPVYNALRSSYLKSVAYLYEELLEYYLIVIYIGQQDIVCNYPNVVDILESLQWSGAEQYCSAPRQRWCEDHLLAGFYKCAGNLCDMLVRNASHMVPSSQPEWSFNLVESVVFSPRDDPLEALSVCN